METPFQDPTRNSGDPAHSCSFLSFYCHAWHVPSPSAGYDAVVKATYAWRVMSMRRFGCPYAQCLPNICKIKHKAVHFYFLRSAWPLHSHIGGSRSQPRGRLQCSGTSHLHCVCLHLSFRLKCCLQVCPPAPRSLCSHAPGMGTVGVNSTVLIGHSKGIGLSWPLEPSKMFPARGRPCACREFYHSASLKLALAGCVSLCFRIRASFKHLVPPLS